MFKFTNCCQDAPQNIDMDWQQAIEDFTRLRLICARPAASDKVCVFPHYSI